MALIQWNDSLSVNIVEIDIQHQKLVGMINDLNDAMLQRKGKDILGKSSMASWPTQRSILPPRSAISPALRIPRRTATKKEHADFVARIADFQKGLAQGRVALSVEVMNFLSDWLRNHIKVVDRKYVPLFRERGVK